MRKTLEKLYYGNLRPCERRMVPSSELRRAVDTINHCEDQIEEQLSDEGKRLLSVARSSKSVKLIQYTTPVLAQGNQFCFV